jgi:hypothetical protein
MALPVTITGISTAVAPAGPFKVAAGTYSAVGQSGVTTTTNNVTAGAFTSHIAAQTFTPSPGYSLSDVSIILAGTGLPAVPIANCYVELRDHASLSVGAPTGTVLGTSDLVSGTLTANGGNTTISFHFATPVALTNLTQYALVFYILTSGAANSVRFVGNAVNDITGGLAYTPLDGSSNTVANLAGQSAAPFDYAITYYKAVTVASDQYYFFGRDGTTGTTLQAFKATAPDTSWASVTTKTGFTTAILRVDAYQVGYTVHLLVQDGTASTSQAVKYLSFDALTDTFLATVETVSAAGSVAGQISGANANASLVVRGNGEVVAFYNGLQTKTSGTFRARIYYRRRTAVNTWSTETQVDGNTAIDTSAPTAVLGAADRVHFLFQPAASVNSIRTLSAANTMNTAVSQGAWGGPCDAVSYDRSGTTKVVATVSVGAAQQTVYFDSSDNPTLTTANQSIAAASTPHRIGVDIDTDEVTIAYRNSSDSDLYAIKSSNDGATFGSPVLAFAGTVPNTDAGLSRSSSGSMYARGSNYVVGYIVNDNGTLKYNEYNIRAITATTNVNVPGISVTASAGALDAQEVLTKPNLIGAQVTASAQALSVSISPFINIPGASATMSAGTIGTSVVSTITVNLPGASATLSAGTFQTISGAYLDSSRTALSDITLSNNYLTATRTSATSNYRLSLSILNDASTTKFYAEAQMAGGGVGLSGDGVGIANASAALTNYLGSDNNSVGIYVAGNIFINGAQVGTIDKTNTVAGDWFGIAVDTGSGRCYFRNITQNGIWKTVGHAGLSGVQQSLGIATFNQGEVFNVNFNGPFLGGPPAASGYTTWDGRSIPVVALAGASVTMSAGTFRGYAGTILNPDRKFPDLVLSNNYLTATRPNAAGTLASVLSTPTHGSTKVYAEVHLDTASGTFGVGVATTTFDVTNGSGFIGQGTDSIGLYGATAYYNGVSAGITVSPAVGTGDWIGIAVDRIAGTIQFRNITGAGSWSATVSISSITSGEICFASTFANQFDAFTANFDGAFLGTPPASGYSTWDGKAIAGGVNLPGASVTMSAGTLGAYPATFFNPDRTFPTIILSNNYLTATMVSGDFSDRLAFSTLNAVGTTKIYAEVQFTGGGGGPSSSIGVANASALVTPLAAYLGWDNNSIGFWTGSGRPVYVGGSNVGTHDKVIAAGDWYSVSADTSAATVSVRNITQNGAWNTFSISALGGGRLSLAIDLRLNGEVFNAKFDGTFLGAPPASGYTTWDGKSIAVSSVSVNLTGASVTASAGSLAQQRVFLTGAQVATFAGSIAPTTARLVSLTGAQASASAGSLAITEAKPLVGASCSASAGTLTTLKFTPANLAGAGCTFSAGTFQFAVVLARVYVSWVEVKGVSAVSTVTNVAVPGIQVSASAGSIRETISKTLPGALCTASPGILTVAKVQPVGLVGAQATATPGLLSVTKAVAVTFTGAQAATTAGVFRLSDTFALIGAQVTSTAGTITATTVSTTFVSLTGAQVTISAGVLAQPVTKVLTGASVTAQAGTLITSIAKLVALTGAQTTASAGTFGIGDVFAFVGAQVTAQIGSLVVNTASTANVAVPGAQVTASPGIISLAARPPTLIGVEATAQAGAMAALVAKVVALTGAQVTASPGSFGVSDIFALLGAQVAASAGTITSAAASTISVNIQGAFVTTFAGTLSAPTTKAVSLIGVQATTSAGLFTVSQAITAVLSGIQVQVTAGAIFARVSAFAIQGAQVQAQAGILLRGARLLGSFVTASAGNLTRFDVKGFLIGAAATAQAGVIFSEIIVPSDIAADHVANVLDESTIALPMIESHSVLVIAESRMALVLIDEDAASVIQQQ